MGEIEAGPAQRHRHCTTNHSPAPAADKTPTEHVLLPLDQHPRHRTTKHSPAPSLHKAPNTEDDDGDKARTIQIAQNMHIRDMCIYIFALNKISRS